MVYCIYDTKYGCVLELGMRERLMQVVYDVYDGDFSRYVVRVWE